MSGHLQEGREDEDTAGEDSPVMMAERQRAVDILVRGRVIERDDVAHSELADSFERVDVRGGEVLFEDGSDGDSVYVITRGRLRVLGDGGSVTVAELGPGQTVGELALLTGESRHGTVVAVRDSVLYRLAKPEFERFCLAHPTAMQHLLVTLARRMTEPPARGRRRATPTNLVVVPVGDRNCASPFGRALAEFLGDHVSAVLVTADTVDDAVEPGASASEPATATGTRTLEYLDALERDNDHVVYVADDAPSEWAKRCVRQADLILLVGAAGARPVSSRIEQWMDEPSQSAIQADRYLVLVEPEAERTPIGTAPWLELRSVDMTHHIHLARPSHFSRLCRFIIGEPCGLVLSGGAARALAHIGVLRALREAGLPIDVIAATSAGALIGAEFAMGWSPDLIQQNNAEVFGGSRMKLLDFTPPFTSIIGSSRFNTALDEIFGETRFEDLWIQFMCTTTDLTSAQGRTHRTGSLRQYVRASCSLPMVMPPVTQDGHLLADGGIMNNVPVDPLLEVTNVGTLVVVNVTNPFYSANEKYNYDDSLPFSRVLNSRLNPFAEKLVAPGILDVLMRSLEIGSKSLEPSQIAKADVYVRPEVSKYGYTDLGFLDDIAAAGRDATIAELAAWDAPDIAFT